MRGQGCAGFTNVKRNYCWLYFSHYYNGYELANKLEQYVFKSFSEETIYPLCLRIQREQLLTPTYTNKAIHFKETLDGSTKSKDYLKGICT